MKTYPSARFPQVSFDLSVFGNRQYAMMPKDDVWTAVETHHGDVVVRFPQGRADWYVHGRQDGGCAERQILIPQRLLPANARYCRTDVRGPAMNDAQIAMRACPTHSRDVTERFINRHYTDVAIAYTDHVLRSSALIDCGQPLNFADLIVALYADGERERLTRSVFLEACKFAALPVLSSVLVYLERPPFSGREELLRRGIREACADLLAAVEDAGDRWRPPISVRA